ncbi:MAG TPA: ABC transporter ATP-binding protein [Lachnospiraceae bacterium]|nr:ABC transporter ATP-binding protein [Lachnospiraceae bacterium]
MKHKEKNQTSDTNQNVAMHHIMGTISYLGKQAWKHFKGYFIVSGVKALVDAMSPFLLILVSPMLIDELIGNRDLDKLICYVAIIAIGGGLFSLTGNMLTTQIDRFDERMNNYFSNLLGRHSMELDFQLTENKDALDQLNAAKNGMEWYSGGVRGIYSHLFELISSILQFAGVVVLIILKAPILFIITAVILVGNVFLQRSVNQVEIKFFKGLSKLNRAFRYYGYNISDFRYGKDIRLYGARKMMVQKWNHFTVDLISEQSAMFQNMCKYQGMSGALSAIREVIIYLYLGILAVLGKISIGGFAQMVAAGSTCYNSLQAISQHIQELIKRCSYAYEFVKYMEYPEALQKGELHVKNQSHTLEFQHVSFTYPGSDTTVLKDISVKLSPGEHLSVVGLNGAGKTTFVKLLCRLYDPTEGEILLDGVNIKEYNYEEYMKLFAPVFQDFKLFAFSIAENILLRETDDSKDIDKEKQRVGELIVQVGLEEKILSLEKGTDTLLFKSFDEKGLEPSGGEQQKLAIARALYKNAPVVILDEPTAALDPVAEYEIYKQFEQLVGGKTAVYISHRLSSCQFCDRIAVFSEGSIMEYGTHKELVNKEDGIYAKMFATQAQYYQN